MCFNKFELLIFEKLCGNDNLLSKMHVIIIHLTTSICHASGQLRVTVTFLAIETTWRFWSILMMGNLSGYKRDLMLTI